MGLEDWWGAFTNMLSSIAPTISSVLPSMPQTVQPISTDSTQQQIANLAATNPLAFPGTASMAKTSGITGTPIPYDPATGNVGAVAGGGTSGGMIADAIKYLLSNPQTAANTWQMIQRYQLASTLSDPSALMKGASGLEMPMGAALKRRIGRDVGAQMQEMGTSGAPGLQKEALAEAIAPYEYQRKQQALQMYIQSLLASGQMYPMGGPESEFSNFLTQYQMQNQ